MKTMRILKHEGVEYRYGFEEGSKLWAKGVGEIKSDTLKNASDSDVLQWYYNAYVTYYNAYGHHKAECNRELKELYAKELDKRGIFYKGMAYTNNLEEGETAGNFSKHNTGVQGGDGSW
tara:strand:+ start:1998 stop:2354 length:357 start_codon:yes stop_codon:yes gene_type:complete